MSLLNDMLRDLSLAQKGGDAAAQAAVVELNQDEQRDLLNQSSVIKQEPGKLWPSLLAFLVVLICLLFAKQILWPHNKLGQTDNVSATHKPMQVAQALVVTEAAVGQKKTQIENTENLGQTTQPIAQDVDKAMPAQKDATEILNERLVSIENAISKLSVTVMQAQLPEVENIPLQANPASFATTQMSVSIRDPFEQVNSAGVQSEMEGPTASSAINSIDETVVPDDAHLSIAPNPAFLDQKTAEQGWKLFNQGQTSDAIIELQAFIAANKTPRESVKVLLDIFSEQENIAAIENLLYTADYLSQVDKQYYAAKVAVIRQQEVKAIELLEENLGEAETNENYRALLAGLYQRAQQYPEAAAAYRRLLGTFGEKPAYWLGLALAQDSLNQWQTAKQAYLRLAEYPELQPQVRTYIQQRLAALQ